MRTYFANGLDKLHIPWAVEGLPMLLHFSLFLFFGGLVIYLFNLDQEVFTCVVLWIGLFTMVYGLITLLPLMRQDSPYNTPLSTPAWFLFANMKYIGSVVLTVAISSVATVAIVIFYIAAGAAAIFLFATGAALAIALIAYIVAVIAVGVSFMAAVIIAYFSVVVIFQTIAEIVCKIIIGYPLFVTYKILSFVISVIFAFILHVTFKARTFIMTHYCYCFRNGSTATALPPPTPARISTPASRPPSPASRPPPPQLPVPTPLCSSPQFPPTHPSPPTPSSAHAPTPVFSQKWWTQIWLEWMGPDWSWRDQWLSKICTFIWLGLSNLFVSWSNRSSKRSQTSQTSQRSKMWPSILKAASKKCSRILETASCILSSMLSSLHWARNKLDELTQSWFHDLRFRDRGLELEGLKKKAEESAREKSSDIDRQILDWTMNCALGDDDTLEKFVEAIPGFFDSKLVNILPLGDEFSTRFSDTFDGFLDRMLSYNSVSDVVKLRRLDISMKAMNLVREDKVSSILEKIFLERYQLPQTVEMGHTLAHWCTSNNQRAAQYARCIVTRFLLTVQKRDDRWVELAARISGLQRRDLLDSISHGGKNLLLSTLIDVSRRAIHTGNWKLLIWLVEILTRLDIRHTLPGLQHDFCSLWNEFVQTAGSLPPTNIPSTYSYVLYVIRHLYTDLHPIESQPALGRNPRAYPSCSVASHHPVPDSPVLSAQPDLSSDPSPTSGGNILLGQVKESDNIAGPPSTSLTTRPGEIEDIPQPPASSLPVIPAHTNSRAIDVSPPSVIAAAPQHIPPATTLSYPTEGTTQQDTLAAFGEPGIDGILSTASTPAPTPTPAPVPAPTTAIPNKSSTSCDAKTSTVSNPLHPTSSESVVDFSISATSPQASPSRFPPLRNAASLAAGNVTMPRLRARGFINAGNMCFVNAALQLLVHSPLLSNLFRELGDLKRQHKEKAGGPETDDRASSPLVDATVRLFEEFMLEEKEAPPTQQSPQQTAVRTPKEEEEAKTVPLAVDSFQPLYLYEAMMEKRQLKRLLVRSPYHLVLYCY